MKNRLRLYFNNISFIGRVQEIDFPTIYHEFTIKRLPTIMGIFVGEIPHQLFVDFYEGYNPAFDCCIENTTMVGRCRLRDIRDVGFAFEISFVPIRGNQLEVRRGDDCVTRAPLSPLRETI